jgi:dTMP kinase
MDWLNTQATTYGSAWSTCEPTEGPIGNTIRLALKKRLQTFDEKTMALLFAADRTDHLYRSEAGGQEGGILTKLERGIHVITDRYVLSSLAYQARELGLDWVYQANLHAIKPNATIFINLSAEEAARRMACGRSHQDVYETLHEQKEIEQQYAQAINYLIDKGQRILQINGNQAPKKVHQDIVRAVASILAEN